MAVRLLLVTIFLFTTGMFAIKVTSAQAFNIPQNCPDTYIPDFNCQYQKLLDPTFECDANICPGENGIGSPEAYTQLISFFGTDMYLYSEQKVVSLLNLAISTFLAVISIFALVYGIYIAAYVRANTTDETKIVETNKVLQRLIIGFILTWSFILIMQFVMSLLGIGSLSETVVFGSNPGGSTIVIN